MDPDREHYLRTRYESIAYQLCERLGVSFRGDGTELAGLVCAVAELQNKVKD